jgi:hypothetical protein
MYLSGWFVLNKLLPQKNCTKYMTVVGLWSSLAPIHTWGGMYLTALNTPPLAPTDVGSYDAVVKFSV